MSYSRRILHYSPGPTDFVGTISDRTVTGCWFELHRQGGCGAGELRLKDTFPERNAIDVGDWIAFEYTSGDRWYFGRVEHRQSSSPAGITFRLEGMGVELNEAFPGGFGPNAGDGTPPHRYAATDLFSNDPDRDIETFDSVDQPHDLVDLLLTQYVLPRTHITRDTNLIESSLPATSITSLKFRGEESARAIIKELALRARNASWGVDEAGRFFFLRPRETTIATFQEGVDIVSLEESRDRDLLFNRIVLTGGYVYDTADNSDEIARRVYRWRGNYVQSASRDQFGERRIRLWVPWIRTPNDSRAFTREFFRTYAQPPSRYLIEVANLQSLPRPWDGLVRILARDGSQLAHLAVASIRVQFDHAPRLRVEVGPADPRILWPEPPHDERWEVPVGVPDYGGESISLTDSGPPSGTTLSSTGESSEHSSDPSSDLSSDVSSDPSSDLSLSDSFDPSSDPSSDISSEVSSDLSSDDNSSAAESSAASSGSENSGSSVVSDSEDSSDLSSDENSSDDQSSAASFSSENSDSDESSSIGASSNSSFASSDVSSDDESSSDAGSSTDLIEIGCCANPIPRQLTATFQNDGGQIALTWNEGEQAWIGSGNANCGDAVTVRFWCLVAGNSFNHLVCELSGDGFQEQKVGPNSGNCIAFNPEFGPYNDVDGKCFEGDKLTINHSS